MSSICVFVLNVFALYCLCVLSQVFCVMDRITGSVLQVYVLYSAKEVTWNMMKSLIIPSTTLVVETHSVSLWTISRTGPSGHRS